MELADLAAQVKSLGAAHQTRRAALRRLGLGSVAAGLLTAVGARSGRSQTWEGPTPTAESAPVAPAIPPAPIAGVSGGLPPFVYALEASAPTQYTAGTVRWATKAQVPPLQGAAFASEHLGAHGLRELHWHLNAGELNYCVGGHAQIGLVAPDGNLQTFAVGPGDIAFLPENWFHYIANVSDEPLQVLIFFLTTDPRVETINLSQTFDNVPAQVLAANFDTDPARFATLPKRGNVGIAPGGGRLTGGCSSTTCRASGGCRLSHQ